MNRITRLAAIGAIALSLFSIACESDAELIRDINEGLTTPTPLSAEVDSVDLQVGDCINSPLPKEVSIYTVEIVTCDSMWMYRVVSSFNVGDHDSYPDKSVFSQIANLYCDRRFSFYLYPESESWAFGDRTIDCLQESFGLSESDPDKLDRLVGFYTLSPGDCYNIAPETDNLLFELVSCADAWESQVTDTFAITGTADYPGSDFIVDQAVQQCVSPWDYYFGPTPETWAAGDRTVVCTKLSE